MGFKQDMPVRIPWYVLFLFFFFSGVGMIFLSLFSRDSDCTGTATVPDTQHGLNNVIFNLSHVLATSWASTQRESIPIPPGLLTAPS